MFQVQSFSHLTRMPDDYLIPEQGVTESIAHDEKQLLAKFVCLAAGAEFAPEDFSLGSFLLFIGGKADVVFGENVLPAQSGASSYAAPFTPYRIVAKTPVSLLMVVPKSCDQYGEGMRPYLFSNWN
jgi:hypothetical protein